MKLPSILYHATPSCYVESIKQLGLGGVVPVKRFWDYSGTKYENIKQGCFLASDEYVAASYLETSEQFEELEGLYSVSIIVFAIDTAKLDKAKLTIDTNNTCDTEDDATYFYEGVIDYKDLKQVLVC